MILVFDSGLGGLTVYKHIASLLSAQTFLYLADDAAFPYGSLSENEVRQRTDALFAALFERVVPDVAVLACNTASTSALAHLRERFPGTAFVGTVPAIKPAAEQTKSGLISVLGTSGTVQRDYTKKLISDFAANCEVTLVGSGTLAQLAEKFVHGGDVSDDELASEIAPCFIETDGKQTDQIVLACTHYPLLLERFEKIAPWPVTFVDPAPAIANRVQTVLGGLERLDQKIDIGPPNQVWTSSGTMDEPAGRLFARYGLSFSADFRCPFP